MSGGGGKDLAISNWTGYMTDQSLSDFQKQTGIKVDYAEDINDNNEYFTKIRPNLSQGQGHRAATAWSSPTGWRAA